MLVLRLRIAERPVPLLEETTVKNRFFVSAALLSSLCSLALADSYSPFSDQRLVAPGGLFYVIIERQGGKHPKPWGPVDLTIAERAPGTSSVEPAKAVVESRDGLFVMTKNANIAVRKDDIVHARITLRHPPALTLVSSTGLGVVLLDYYGINSRPLETGYAVTLLSLTGDVRHERKLSDILTQEEISRYDNQTGSVWWLGGSWIDETDHEVVIIGSTYNLGKADRPIVLVNLDSGKVRRGGKEDVRKAITQLNPGGLELALDIAMDMKLQNIKETLTKIVLNNSLSQSTRLRASVLLAKSGTMDGAPLLVRAALMASKNQLDDLTTEYDEGVANDVGYAIEHLPDVLGERALPVLREVTRKYGYGIRTMHAFCRLGEPAIPTLIKMLEDQGDVEGQYLAAEALASVGSYAKAAVPALVKALDMRGKTSRGWRIDSIAAYALGEIGTEAKAAIPALSKLATNDDEEVRISAIGALKKITK
jgi:hypothetical protein